MDSVTEWQQKFPERVTRGDASVTFAAFVFAHAGCEDEVIEFNCSFNHSL